MSGNLGRMASPPAWSPDGSRIAYAAAWEGNEEIYVMNADGGGPHVNITNHPGNDRSPAWRRNPPAPKPTPPAELLPDDLVP